MSAKAETDQQWVLRVSNNLVEIAAREIGAEFGLTPTDQAIADSRREMALAMADLPNAVAAHLRTMGESRLIAKLLPERRRAIRDALMQQYPSRAAN